MRVSGITVSDAFIQRSGVLRDLDDDETDIHVEVRPPILYQICQWVVLPDTHLCNDPMTFIPNKALCKTVMTFLCQFLNEFFHAAESLNMSCLREACAMCVGQMLHIPGCVEAQWTDLQLSYVVRYCDINRLFMLRAVRPDVYENAIKRVSDFMLWRLEAKLENLDSCLIKTAFMCDVAERRKNPSTARKTIDAYDRLTSAKLLDMDIHPLIVSDPNKIRLIGQGPNFIVKTFKLAVEYPLSLACIENDALKAEFADMLNIDLSTIPKTGEPDESDASNLARAFKAVVNAFSQPNTFPPD